MNWRSPKLRDTARGRACTVNGPNCNYDDATTVYCHLNESFAGKGLGIKAHDIGFFGCSNCHADYDQGRLPDKYFYLLRAIVRTMLECFRTGLIKVA